MTDTDPTPLPVLQIIVASTRPGRVGPAIGEWIEQAARAHGAFQVELVDLADVGLPFFDEPHHPRLGRYEHQHTKDWSATVSRADAFVIVTPEYNHSFNAVLKNALDFLYQEWNYKPVGFVSYGGVAAGARAVQALHPVIAVLRMVPVVETVTIPSVYKVVHDDAVTPTEPMQLGATAMFDELAAQTVALAPRRRAG